MSRDVKDQCAGFRARSRPTFGYRVCDAIQTEPGNNLADDELIQLNDTEEETAEMSATEEETAKMSATDELNTPSVMVDLEREEFSPTYLMD